MKRKKVEETNEEIVYDNSDSSEVVSVDLKNKIDKLKNDLVKCQDEKREYLEGWQRSKADFINFKKRAEESRKEFLKYATEETISQFLPILDNFEQAFKDQKWQSVDGNWRKGIEMIHNQILEILKKNKITEIDTSDQTFDPQMHECVELVEVEDEKYNDKILEVVQKGYKMEDKIIRHPRVKVGKFNK